MPRNENSNTAVRERTYRSGGGMSQAQRQPQTQVEPCDAGVARDARLDGDAARGRARRAASRKRARTSALRRRPSRESRGGGMGQAQRAAVTAAAAPTAAAATPRRRQRRRWRGGGGGGREHPAARGSEGRGAAR